MTDETPVSSAVSAGLEPPAGPAPTTACVQACTSVAPALAVVAFQLPMVSTGHVSWSLRAIALSGLSPPPDPFPPRT